MDELSKTAWEKWPEEGDENEREKSHNRTATISSSAGQTRTQPTNQHSSKFRDTYTSSER